MEIEAGFTQTPDGKDNWGHDVIYEFTGDDDFWLYVDGELVIDLGGIHSAVPGSVNFATGRVNVNGTSTTLRDIFYQNYLARDGHTAEQAQQYVDGIFELNANGDYVFTEYSTHTMRIFYLERGAGASNLHMRFNLASVKPGSVLLTKELEGADEEVYAQFPFQIYYKGENIPEELLTQSDGLIKVYYKDTVNKVTYYEHYTFPGTACTYDDVFMLRPGETAEINIPEGCVDYKILECGVNTGVYSQVRVNGTAVVGESAAGLSADCQNFSTGWAVSSEQPRVTFTNVVKPNSLSTLTIRKHLYDYDGLTRIFYPDDDAVFDFRLFLATEYGELMLTDQQAYHVKDENGSYCKWDYVSPGKKGFVSLDKTVFDSLTDAEKESATFHTSIRGAISQIPIDYTVEIRDLLAGTQYRVEERSWEVPDGYLFMRYEFNNNAQEVMRDPTGDAVPGVVGTVTSGTDPNVDVCNKRVWALRLDKTWSDAEFMKDRAPAYFAVYTESGGTLTLVPGSVKQMPYKGSQTLYWYYDCLDSALQTGSFSSFVVYEVELTNAGIDANGDLIYDSIAIVPQAGSVKYHGITKESTESDFYYNVDYTAKNPKEHLKQYEVTNSRSDTPLLLKKSDWVGDPLSGAVFKLKNSSGVVLGAWTSGEDGVVTAAYQEKGHTYTLTETSSPTGYQVLLDSVQITMGSDGSVSAAADNSSYFVLTQRNGSDPAVLTVKNRPYAVTVVKKDRNTNASLEGAVFTLDQEVTTNGTASFTPMYTGLTTNAQGQLVLGALPVGVYRLRETAAPDGYQKITDPDAIIFTVSKKGAVELRQQDPSFRSDPVVDTGGTCRYTLTVKNYRMINPDTGVNVEPLPFGWMLLLCTSLLSAASFGKRRRYGD